MPCLFAFDVCASAYIKDNCTAIRTILVVRKDELVSRNAKSVFCCLAGVVLASLVSYVKTQYIVFTLLTGSFSWSIMNLALFPKEC